MKEITRRLYTKPVMLGMAFFVGVAIVIGLFVTTKSTAAPNGFPVVFGNDEFETAADGQTFHDFEGSNIPAGFFGAHSLAYGEQVALEGVPLAPGSEIDTVIYRHQTVQSAGGSTPITMTGLSMKASSPLTIHFNNGVTTWTEQWNMNVGLSAYKASTGSMTINASTFDSTLKVWPKFTFTKVGGGTPLVLDTGAPGGPGLTADSDSATIGSLDTAPRPSATVAPAPCAVIDTFEPVSKVGSDTSFTAAATTSSCPPITLSSVNQPWGPCVGGGFCIWVPITEEERWARHRPGPRGFKASVKGGAVAE